MLLTIHSSKGLKAATNVICGMVSYLVEDAKEIFSVLVRVLRYHNLTCRCSTLFCQAAFKYQGIFNRICYFYITYLEIRCLF